MKDISERNLKPNPPFQVQLPSFGLRCFVRVRVRWPPDFQFRSFRRASLSTSFLGLRKRVTIHHFCLFLSSTVPNQRRKSLEK